MDNMVSDTYIILQARMNSTRLPEKVMHLIGGTPLIGILFKRIKMPDFQFYWRHQQKAKMTS
jgi:spore coat polysaccharide biosynthesis protein SpsF (cytidylyltransferase family)